MTDCCRICLSKKAKKDVSELQYDIPGIDKKHQDQDIILFCLDIQVSQECPQVSKGLCNICYKKVISFYIFKVQAIKNDAYLRSLQTTEQDKDTNMQDHNLLKSEVTEYLAVKIEAGYDVYNDQSELSLNNDLNYLNIKAEDTQDTEKEESDNDILSVLKRKNRLIRQNSLSEKNYKEENCKISSNIAMKALPKKGGPKKKTRIHLMNKKKCTICDKDYTDLTAHTLLVHDKEKLRFVCTVCERRCISQSALNCHLESHTKDKPFQCDKCNKKFKSKLLLATHVRNMHDQDRPHMCHLCSKSYFKKNALQIHIRIHTKELPYPCGECGKRFRTRDCLKKHLVRHTGVKKFACTLCEKKFYNQGSLSAHMITHTKEKRHACRFCGVKFGRSDHRSQHELTAHGHKSTIDWRAARP